VILATKVFNPVRRKANLAEPNTDGRSLSAYKIRKHSEGSLKRLQTEHIDLYQMHHVDRDCPWDETWQAFEHWATRARWFTWALATSRDGTSLPLAKRLLNAVWRGYAANKVSTISTTAWWSWR
jgi:predicted oxidoreductase